MAWASKFKKLTSNNSVIDLTGLSGKKFQEFMVHTIKTGEGAPLLRLNNNPNAVYPSSYSENGSSPDQTQITRTNINLLYNTDAVDRFTIGSCCNISGEEKLLIIHNIQANTTGAGNAPHRTEEVVKFVPSPDASIIQYHIRNNEDISFAADSLTTVIETDS